MSIVGLPPTARTRRVASVVVALATTALAVGVLQGLGRADHSVPPAPAVPSAAVVFNGTDNAFVQLLIPMNEGALALFDHLDARAGHVDPDLLALAKRLRATHLGELREMRSLLAAGNLAEENVHEGHQMPGMVTEIGLAELRAAPVSETSVRATALLRAHLAQTILLCQGHQRSGDSPPLHTLTARMHQDRTAELAELDALTGAVAAVSDG
jgi:uncharacterized protein (DUF305 family)